MIKVHDIFPTRVATASIGRSITEDELNAALMLSRFDNVKLSDNKYVFNTVPELKSIYDFCARSSKEYIDALYSPCYPMDFYITQSWCTYIDDMELFHRHDHQNCLFSATFYLDCEEGDSITLYNDRYNQIIIDTATPEILDMRSQDVKIKPGTLVFFPAYLPHSVPAIPRSRTRVCVAFNVFARGQFGEESSYNALHL